jgi:SAM-dependent methyltransferase
MANTDKDFIGSIPAIYDTVLGPVIFEPYAADLAARISMMDASRILETAAGSGIVTRALLQKLPASAAIVATDLNLPMLDHAAARASDTRVRWRKADAQDLPFEDETFDVVVCQFGVMFFPDRRKAFSEARRVLRPGGSFIFNAWDRIEENEFADVVTFALAGLFPADPPRFLARTPHGYHETKVILDDLRGAGFGATRLETVVLRSFAASCRDPALGFCQGTPLRNEIESRNPAKLAEATDAATRALETHFGVGPIDGKMQAHVVVARR